MAASPRLSRLCQLLVDPVGSDGELGGAVAETLNQINGGLTEAVYRRLGLERGCRVL